MLNFYLLFSDRKESGGFSTSSRDNKTINKFEVHFSNFICNLVNSRIFFASLNLIVLSEI